MLIVEDLHWASEVTREVVEVIARSARRSRLVVVATTRDRPGHDRYAALLGRLTRSAGVVTVSLAGLDVAAATQLIAVERSCSTPAKRSRAVVATRSSCANWYVMAPPADRWARRSPICSPASMTSTSTSLTTRSSAAIRSRRRAWRLPRDAVSTHPRRAGRAEAIGIVRDGERPGVFVFTHDVFRSGRHAMLTAGRRMRLHAAIAAAMDRPDLGDHVLATVARHASLAGPRFDPKRAAELSRRAGDVARRAADHAGAAEHTAGRWSRCPSTPSTRTVTGWR